MSHQYSFDLEVLSNAKGDSSETLHLMSTNGKLSKFSKKDFSILNHFYNTNKKKFLDNKKTKNRGEVSGSTRKIFKQKGTGRARHGSIKAPQFKGGGVSFGPILENKSYLKLNKTFKKNYFTSVFFWKINNNKVSLLENFFFSEFKTKEANNVLINLFPMAVKKKTKLGASVLVVVSKNDFESEKIIRCFRNIERVTVASLDSLNARYLLLNNYVLLSKNSLLELGKIKNFTFN